MKNRARNLSSMAVAALLMSASPASADVPRSAVYFTIFYSDSTYQTQIGYRRLDGCSYFFDEPIYYIEGSYSQYEVADFIGYCQNGRFVLSGFPPE